MTKGRLLLLALLSAAAAAMAWLAVYQVDDAYIVYRYARNLAHGDGLVFNVGERVEGITCFLWAVVLAPFAAARISLPAIAPILTAACGLGTLAVVARRQADLDDRPALAGRDLSGAALLASIPAFLYWSVGALETVPFALLLSLALREHARELESGERRPRSAVWLGLAALTRPEASVVILALGAHRASREVREGRAARLAKWIGAIAAIVVPFVVFRRVYYGAWVPNTFAAKTGDPLSDRAVAGAGYLRDAIEALVPVFGAASPAIAVVGVALVAALLIAALRRKRLRGEGLAVLALLAACIYEGGDWMVFSRFLVPALPALAVIAGWGLARAVDRTAPARLAVAGLVALFVASGLTVAERARNGGTGLVVQREGYRHAHERIGRELAARGRRGDAVALMDVGMIGWLAPDLDVIDISGLTDRAIAHAPGPFLDKRFPVADLLARRPRFVVLVPGFGADERIHDDAAFQAGYQRWFAVNHRFNWDPPSEYVLNVFERRPLP